MDYLLEERNCEAVVEGRWLLDGDCVALLFAELEELPPPAIFSNCSDVNSLSFLSAIWFYFFEC